MNLFSKIVCWLLTDAKIALKICSVCKMLLFGFFCFNYEHFHYADQFLWIKKKTLPFKTLLIQGGLSQDSLLESSQILASCYFRRTWIPADGTPRYRCEWDCQSPFNAPRKLLCQLRPDNSELFSQLHFDTKNYF